MVIVSSVTRVVPLPNGLNGLYMGVTDYSTYYRWGDPPSTTAVEGSNPILEQQPAARTFVQKALDRILLAEAGSELKTEEGFGGIFGGISCDKLAG